MTEPKCPSCGTPWVEHCGPIRLCKDLQDAVALMKYMIVHLPMAYSVRSNYGKRIKAMNDFIAKHGGKK